MAIGGNVREVQLSSHTTATFPMGAMWAANINGRIERAKAAFTLFNHHVSYAHIRMVRMMNGLLTQYQVKDIL